jgi:hypothetical protein
MAQYLQLGICHRITFDKKQLKKLDLTTNDVAEKLSEKMDMALFTCHEDEEEITFVLKEPVLVEQLHDFLKSQFALYSTKENQEHFNSILRDISNLQSMLEIVELAKEGSTPNFINNSINEHIEMAPWKRIRVELSLIVILVEGKIIMEDYNDLLHYLENLVRANSGFPIAGAFRAIID